VLRPYRHLGAPQGDVFVFNANAIRKEVDKIAAQVFGQAL